MDINEIETNSFINEIYDKMEMKCNLVRLHDSDNNLSLGLNIMGKYDELYLVYNISTEDIFPLTKVKVVLGISKRIDNDIKMCIKKGLVYKNYNEIKEKNFKNQEELKSL